MLPFTVYREIGNANFGDDKTNKKKQGELLEAAKKEKLSSTEVRNLVRHEQGKDDKPMGHRYLLLNVSNFGNSEIVRNMPEEVQEHQENIEEVVRGFFCRIQEFKKDFEDNERGEKCFGKVQHLINEIVYEAKQLGHINELYDTMCNYRKKVWKLTSEES